MEKFILEKESSLFLLIDFQSNLATAMEKDVYAVCERNAGLLISCCDILSVPIIITEQYSRGLGNTVKPLQNALKDNYQPIEKLDFSCFHVNDVSGKLRELQRKYVLVAGIESHVCVLQSVLDLLGNGYFVHVISDAVCSRYKADWRNAMAYMKDAGAVVTTTEIAVFQLLGRAGTSEFKAVSPLFKNKEEYWSKQ